MRHFRCCCVCVCVSHRSACKPFSCDLPMTYLKKIREAQTLKDIAHILGVQPKTVSYLLYILPDAEKYRPFEIPKRNGGKRLINAPEPRLKMVQRRLANVLYECIAEAEKCAPPRRPLAHGFARPRVIGTDASKNKKRRYALGIFSNAAIHKNRRYVLNLDLEDFFPSLNFGRVRGFFIKDKRFELNEKVATVIAQIACHRNELPQGSPCSPIISNLLGHLLDVRLFRLARKYKCTYSRYADDITFSTNRKDFPAALAKPIPEKVSYWQLGSPLVKQIQRAGFKVNNDKTRMQWRGSRQMATGLIVNKKVNIRSEYYRTARAICNRLFSTGEYYISDPEKSLDGLNKIEGILSHIHYIKDRADLREKEEKKKDPLAIRKLYRRFLFYKHFVALEKPLIVTEGKTDPIYLRAAISKLPKYHPQLGEFVNGKFSSAIRFLKYSDTIDKILRLSGGTGNLKDFILKNYKKDINSFKFQPLAYPVIILIDNDQGARDIFNMVTKRFEIKISPETTQSFYHLHKNLYIVKTPENGKNSISCIEDLFDPELRETPIDGKTFDFSKKNKADDKHGKTVFATKVIRPQADQIDFSRFEKLLDRIIVVLDDYYVRQKSSSVDS